MTKGFISYAHDDHGAFKDMCTHIAGIEHAFNIDFWRDKRIRAGTHWNKDIETAIATASVHLLLITPSFIASDYIVKQELPAINAKYHAGDLVLPVIVERCMWQPFVGALQAMPTTSRGRLQAVMEWRPRSLGFDSAREQMATAIAAHLGTPSKLLLDWTKAP